MGPAQIAVVQIGLAQVSAAEQDPGRKGCAGAAIETSQEPPFVKKFEQNAFVRAVEEAQA